jgi:hypothetical protein
LRYLCHLHLIYICYCRQRGKIIVAGLQPAMKRPRRGHPLKDINDQKTNDQNKNLISSTADQFTTCVGEFFPSHRRIFKIILTICKVHLANNPTNYKPHYENSQLNFLRHFTKGAKTGQAGNNLKDFLSQLK